jgi:hypothetical protein
MTGAGFSAVAWIRGDLNPGSSGPEHPFQTTLSEGEPEFIAAGQPVVPLSQVTSVNPAGDHFYVSSLSYSLS